MSALLRRTPFYVLLAVVVLSMSVAWSVQQAHAADVDTVRERLVQLQNGGPNIDNSPGHIRYRINYYASRAETLWQSMNKMSGRTYLWSNDENSATSMAAVRTAYTNLAYIALGYSSKGSKLSGNAGLKNDILAALEFLHNRFYNPSKKPYGNWHDWEIAIPLQLESILLMMGSDVSSAQITKYLSTVHHYNPDPRRTEQGPVVGTGVAHKVQIMLRAAVLEKRTDRIASLVPVINEVYELAEQGDGIYKDGSFIEHDKYAYTGQYGEGLLTAVSEVIYAVHGTQWQIRDPRLQNLYNWILQGIAPLIQKGAVMDMVRGRQIGVSYLNDHTQGHAIITALLPLVHTAPSADAKQMKSYLKYWIMSDTYRDYFEKSGAPFTLDTAYRILTDPAVAPYAQGMSNIVYGSMDKVVHQRPNFAFGISMYSARTGNYEAINNENLKGWYTSDGMTYLYNDDLSHYSNQYWATINPYRLPGTTVDTVTREAVNKTRLTQDHYSSKTWVGGASLLGRYGASGMELQAEKSTLEARKSWFMFDNEIVAIGSAIRSRDNRTIETVVENRGLNPSGTNRLTVNRVLKSSAVGWTETMSNVTTAHLAGNSSGAGADIGYYFPSPVTLKGLRETRSSGSTSRSYMTLWFDHGRNPAQAQYTYVLLPNQTEAATEAYAADPDIRILKQTDTIHAVNDRRLGVTGANFFEPGGAGFIRVEQPSSVMVREIRDQIVVAVADPTQKQSKVIVELYQQAAKVAISNPKIKVLQMSPTIKLEVNVAGLRGQSVELTLDKLVTRTSAALKADGSFVRTLSTVVEAGGTARESKAVMTPDVADLQPDRSGRVSIVLPYGTEELHLPTDVVMIMEGAALEVVHADGHRWTIRPEWLNRLVDAIPEDEADGARLVLQMQMRMPSAEEQAAISQGVGGFPFLLKGCVADTQVFAETAGGKRLGSDPFDIPSELSFNCKSQHVEDPDLLGIYRFEAGRWTYVGGARTRIGERRLDAQTFSDGIYAVLQYDRSFEDVQPDHPDYDAIRFLTARQILSGVDDYRFAPDRPVNRAEYVAMLVRAMKLRAVGSSLPFTDVPADAWYREALIAAYEAGIVGGYSDGSFGAERSIKREEMAVMLMRVARVVEDLTAEYAEEPPLIDEASEYARADIGLALRLGLMRTDGPVRQFAAQGYSTRAEVAQAIWQLLSRYLV